MNPHLARAPERWGAAPGHASLAVLAMHGRDQTPAFMRGVAERIALPDLHWVAPAAHQDSWYPLSFLAETGNEPRLGQALELVETARAALAADGFGPERLALVGFSQGAVLLAEHLVRTGAGCATAALLTGGYVGAPGVVRRADHDLAGMPVLLGSAAADVLVPIDRVRETADLLTQLGAAVTLETYDDLEHLVSDRAVAATRRALQVAAGARGSALRDGRRR